MYAYAVLMVFVIPIGVPAGYAALLVSKRHLINPQDVNSQEEALEMVSAMSAAACIIISEMIPTEPFTYDHPTVHPPNGPTIEPPSATSGAIKIAFRTSSSCTGFTCQNITWQR